MSCRRCAAHAGTWYNESKVELEKQFVEWIGNAKSKGATVNPRVRAIISPHAGYSYCGRTAAFSYASIDPQNIERVFILGPSHHKFIPGYALPVCNIYDTPFGSIELDAEVIQQLDSTGKFQKFSSRDDEREHSLEMQLPFLKYVMGKKPFKLVPIVVGSTDENAERALGEMLIPFLNDPKNFFIISSDFCHWGERFDYVNYDQSKSVIADGIESLDRKAMNSIESMIPKNFTDYLRETENTICGRHPISAMLYAVALAKLPMRFRFIDYSQSSRVKLPKESSVSYAAGILVHNPVRK